MMHGDERGLRLPPAVAPHQVVVIPIQPGEGQVLEQAHALAAELRAAGIRVKLDDRDHVRPGAKFFEWELKGAPIRVELGERELAGGEVSVARRDREPRERLPLDGLGNGCKGCWARSIRSCSTAPPRTWPATRGSLDDRAELIEYLKAGQRLRGHRMVRLAGVRGRDQGGDIGDPPLPHPRARGSRRALRRLRAAGR